MAWEQSAGRVTGLALEGPQMGSQAVVVVRLGGGGGRGGE